MMHSSSFTLAKRLSNRNEPDLLHDTFIEDASVEQSPTYSKDLCKAIVDKMCVDSSLPSDCLKFPDLMTELKRRNSDKSAHAIAFAGMSAGEQAAAMAARKNGQLSHAQFQRRLTSTSRSLK